MGLYLRPTSLPDALAALAARPCTILAGGTDHFPARVVHTPDETILDITALPGLRRIEAHPDCWRIGALTTWTELIEADLPPVFDGFRAAARQVGGVQVQNAGTVCGNLCNASPAADGIPNLMALDAVVELASTAGTRALPVADFVLGNRCTARGADELVTSVRIPRPELQTRSVFLKLGARKYLVISIVMVAAVVAYAADGRIASARVAVGACAPVAKRLPELEAAIVAAGAASSSLVQPAHVAPLSPIDDVRGTAAYRQEATLELLRRAMEALGEPRKAAA